jgi:hypothetical protein
MVGFLGWRTDQHTEQSQPLPLLTDANSAEVVVMNGWFFVRENISTQLTASASSIPHRR